MLYLLDADAVIKADALYYPRARFPVFWDWLLYMGTTGAIKIPQEQYEEVTAGQGPVVDWLNEPEVREALLLDEEADPAVVGQVTLEGYGQLDDVGLEKVGRDPFLISYGRVDPANRTVVTQENSAPGKQGANRKIPDVCNSLGVNCRNLFQLIAALDFTTNWQRPDD